MPISLPSVATPIRVLFGDCLDKLPALKADRIDAVVCDPPYGLKFMGKDWDHGVPGIPFWEAIGRVCKPGAYLFAFGGTRTWHRLACAIEDAGWQIRDTVMWLYGTGFPKGKACLKPAWEPILLCRKPGRRVLPLGVDECRVTLTGNDGWDVPQPMGDTGSIYGFRNGAGRSGERVTPHSLGRWPANVVHDGSDEVTEAFAAFGESKPKAGRTGLRGGTAVFGQKGIGSPDQEGTWPDDMGGTAARFYYCAKASRAERGEGNNHPTVKPLELVRWLVRLVSASGGIVLDPFAGSGTTGLACIQESRRCLLIEKEEVYVAICKKRLGLL